jgi:hypothetical protein
MTTQDVQLARHNLSEAEWKLLKHDIGQLGYEIKMGRHSDEGAIETYRNFGDDKPLEGYSWFRGGSVRICFYNMTSGTGRHRIAQEFERRGFSVDNDPQRIAY